MWAARGGRPRSFTSKKGERLLLEQLENKYKDQYCRFQLTGNWFTDFNPLSKLVILLALAFTALVLQNWVYGLCLCVFYYIFSILLGKLRYFNRIFAKLLLVVGIFIIVIRQLSVEGSTVIFSLFGWKWTWEGLENGLNMAFIILGFSGAVVLFYAVTPMRDLMYSFEQKGVSHTTSYVMLASFQTITDLKASAQTILDSQKARGVETEGNVLVRVKALMPVMGPLLLGAISSAEEKSISMDARAFSVEREHTFLRELRPVPAWEKVVVVLSVLYLVALIALRIYSTVIAGRGA